jgi:hypothetical protein
MLISELSVKIMDEFVKMKKALKLKLKPNVTSKAKTERLMLRIFDENIYVWLDPLRPVREVVPNGGNVVAFLKRHNKRNPKPAADVAEEPATDDDEDNIAGTEEEGETDEEREENDEDGSDSDSDSEAEADDGESGKCLAVRPFETREMSGCLVYEAGAGAGASITPADVLAVEGADTTQAVGATTAPRTIERGTPRTIERGKRGGWRPGAGRPQKPIDPNDPTPRKRRRRPGEPPRRRGRPRKNPIPEDMEAGLIPGKPAAEEDEDAEEHEDDAVED